MASEADSDYNSRLAKSIEEWAKDHLQGRWQVVIKPRQTTGRPVRLNEVGSSRLSFYYATQKLEDTLLPFLQEDLEHLAIEIRELGMPPFKACERFEQRAKEASKLCSDRFRQSVSDLRSAKKGLWNERERQFSEDEIESYSKGFELSARELRDAAVSDFESLVWTEARQTNNAKMPVVISSKGSRERKRKAFVEPILSKKGWSPFEWATEANVDKNSIRDYMKGTIAKPRRSTLKKMADALGVEVLKMPE